MPDVQEGVHIPTGFQAGIDVDEDRIHYKVSDAGIVVIGKKLLLREPAADTGVPVLSGSRSIYGP
jgi:hypothetical protein